MSTALNFLHAMGMRLDGVRWRIRYAARRLLALSPAEQRGFIGIVLVLAAVRVALWTQPLGRINRWIAATRPRKGTALRAAASEMELARTIARRVRWGAEAIPRATCLTQALSAQFLLRREGIETHLRIGVTRQMPGKPLAAHAWLECHGQILLGAEEMPNYTELATSAARAS